MTNTGQWTRFNFRSAQQRTKLMSLFTTKQSATMLIPRPCDIMGFLSLSAQVSTTLHVTEFQTIENWRTAILSTWTWQFSWTASTATARERFSSVTLTREESTWCITTSKPWSKPVKFAGLESDSMKLELPSQNMLKKLTWPLFRRSLDMASDRSFTDLLKSITLKTTSMLESCNPEWPSRSSRYLLLGRKN